MLRVETSSGRVQRMNPVERTAGRRQKQKKLSLRIALRQKLALDANEAAVSKNGRDGSWSYRWSRYLKSRMANIIILMLVIGLAHDTSAPCSQDSELLLKRRCFHNPDSHGSHFYRRSQINLTPVVCISKPNVSFSKADIGSSTALLKVTRQQGAKHHICSGLTSMHFLKHHELCLFSLSAPNLELE